MKFKEMTLVVASVLTLGSLSLAGQQNGSATHWVGIWSTAGTWRAPATAVPSGAPPLVPFPTPTATTAPAATPAVATQPAAGRGAPPPPVQFSGQTLREVVHTTFGGDRLRVVLSNAFGTAPITVGAAGIALRDKESAIVAGSAKPLLFAGQATTTIPAGAMMISDAVTLSAQPMSDLAIDLFLPSDTATWPSPLTIHNGANETNYVSSTGNHVGEAAFTTSTTVPSWFLLARVEAMAPANAASIVTLGDSITDGTRSTPGTNSRWPDVLARRLQANAATRHLSVLNAGIAGNRVLGEGNSTAGINVLARFDRDVLAQPGVRYVVVLEGINDIGLARQSATPSAADLIAGHQQMIERAHVHGLKIIGATLTPFEGAAYYTPEGEVKRQAVNSWIRTSKAYDGVIDFDAVIRDPAQSTKFLPAFNSGDNLHPNDAGYKAMGEAIDLGLFK
jgi:lysophospholipase L1-like esterase